MKSLIIVITICATIFCNSFFFVWKYTRRSADEVVKINESYKQSDQSEEACLGDSSNTWNKNSKKCEKIK